MHCASLDAKNKLTILHALTVRSGIQRGSPPLLLLYVWLGNKFIWAWCTNSDSGVDCRTNIKHVHVCTGNLITSKPAAIELPLIWTLPVSRHLPYSRWTLLHCVLLESTISGWLVFFLFYWQKNLFQLIWLITFFNQLQTSLKRLK